MRVSSLFSRVLKSLLTLLNSLRRVRRRASVCVGGGIVVLSALVRSALSSASSLSDVVVESEFGSMWAASTMGSVASVLDVVVVSVVGRCDVVRVKIVNPVVGGC